MLRAWYRWKIRQQLWTRDGCLWADQVPDGLWAEVLDMARQGSVLVSNYEIGSIAVRAHE